MATLTLESVPDELYQKLKQLADQDNTSIQKQVVIILEKNLSPSDDKMQVVKLTDVEDAYGNVDRNHPKRKLYPGCAKDKVWMSDDFDDPLDDFAEYM